MADERITTAPPGAYVALRVVSWVALALVVISILFVGWLVIQNWNAIHV